MLEYYINRSGRALRCGYTTGVCAAGAAKAAARMLLSGRQIEAIDLDTPKGIHLVLEIADVHVKQQSVSCAIRKDSGDDPDITNGILVYAEVMKTDVGINIEGGTGVGIVTKPGMDQPVGMHAINSTPRRMIKAEVEKECLEYNYSGGLRIVISIPEGEMLARKTFNPRLGIEGGLSIIGTTGIVEPMSNDALVETIRLEMSMLRACGESKVMICPGNYGEAFARNHLRLTDARIVSISNFIGRSIEIASEMDFRQVLLIGHIGKLVKLGIGMYNTHSFYGDGRMETLIACALECNADSLVLRQIQQCATTDAALEILSSHDLLDPVMEVLGLRIQCALERWRTGDMDIGYICFTNADPFSGVLVQSSNAKALLSLWK